MNYNPDTLHPSSHIPKFFVFIRSFEYRGTNVGVG